MISWNWPLLDIRWIPEIVSYIHSVPSSPWEVIERDLSILSPNKRFSKYLLVQLKLFLTDFGLITDKRGTIYLNISPEKGDIIDFLQNIYNNCNDDWAITFRDLFVKKQSFEYSKDIADPYSVLSFLSSQSSFRQWGEFFEFINKAFLIDQKILTPISSITQDMIEDTNFLDRILKRRQDPRILLDIKSKQQKADTLLFTKGETKISITKDNNIKPSINPEIFINARPADDPTNFLYVMDKAIEEYSYYVRTLYKQYLGKDIGTYIYSSKVLFDHFAWGKENLLCDYIDPDRIKRLKDIWEGSLKIKIPLNFWNEFPKVYMAVTHLFWNIAYFCNYLNRPINQMTFDQDAVSHEYINNKLSIRCRRSRISLTKIMQMVWMIYKRVSLPEIEPKVRQIKKTIENLHEIEMNYLPQDLIDRKTILDKISRYVFISNSDIEELVKKHEDIPKYIQNPLLERLVSISDYHNMKETRYISALLRLKEKVDKFEVQLSNDIKMLDNSFDRNIQSAFDNNMRHLRQRIKVEPES